ncbi:transposable element Tcb1 transposase [Trichonephila clavipes]|nr:transposable element Tcb1 transposase [Trichonephila clavipes]
MCVCSEVPLAQTIFMDDNARPHQTLAVEELLESEDVTRMDWPAYSPDLNPIEHVWDALRRCIAARLHHPENTQQLKQMLIEEWVLLPQEMLHQLVLKTKRRPKGHDHGLSGQGWKYFETAEFVNCSRATVVKVYRAWQNGTVQNQRRGKCGAPRAIDDRGERRLRRCVRADRRATVEQLTTKMNQGATKSVSQTTIQRTLLRLGLRSRRLVRAPMLTAVHRRRRLEFARQYSS